MGDKGEEVLQLVEVLFEFGESTRLTTKQLMVFEVSLMISPISLTRSQSSFLRSWFMRVGC